MGGRRLEMAQARVGDTSGYSCQATNIAGMADKDFYLQVLGTYTIRLQLVTYHVLQRLPSASVVIVHVHIVRTLL